MKAVVFAGGGGVRVEDVPDPVVHDRDEAIVRVRLSAICGSDLHLLSGRTPGGREGSVIGHEFVGEVVDGDPSLAGERVLGSFLIACGECGHCRARRFNFCSNRRALGLGTLNGDLDGAQAELVRVPVASLNLKVLDDNLSDEKALFGGDILATATYAADLAEITGETIAVVIGAGPVGLLTALSIRRLGPARLLVLDADEERAAWARSHLDLDARALGDRSGKELVAEATAGALADVALDAVGAVPVFRSAMRCVRDGGRVVIVGLYGAERYELPLGMSWIRGLDLRFSGVANVQGYWDAALNAVRAGEIDPASLITHRLPLERAEEGYELFASRRAMKVLLFP